MESKWRMDVAEEGLAYGFVSLIARSLQFPSWYFTNHFNVNGTGPIVYQRNLVSGQLEPSFTSAKQAGFNNFPYGWAVEPDH